MIDTTLLTHQISCSLTPSINQQEEPVPRVLPGRHRGGHPADVRAAAADEERRGGDVGRAGVPLRGHPRGGGAVVPQQEPPAAQRRQSLHHASGEKRYHNKHSEIGNCVKLFIVTEMLGLVLTYIFHVTSLAVANGQ